MSRKISLPRFKAQVSYGLGTKAKPYLARASNFRIVCGVTGTEWLMPNRSLTQPWKVLLQPAQALLDGGYSPDTEWRLDWVTDYGSSCVFVGKLRAASAIAGTDPNIILIKRTEISRFREWANCHIPDEYSILKLAVQVNAKKTTKTAVMMTDAGLVMWMLATDFKYGRRFLPKVSE